MNNHSTISMPDISSLDENHRLKASYLVMDALPPYYNVDGISESEMGRAVTEMLGKPGSEVGQGFAAVDGQNLVGVLTYIHSGKLAFARLAGTQALIKQLPEQSAKLFRNHLGNYDAGFGTVPENSTYLCRIAVDYEYRGSGIAGRMMEKFLSLEGSSGSKTEIFSLHVDKENSRAIAFYKKHGFIEYERGTRYLTMVFMVGE